MKIDLSSVEHLENYIVILDHGYKEGKAYSNASSVFDDLQKYKGSHVENMEIFFIFNKGVPLRGLSPCAENFSSIFNQLFPQYKNNEIQFLFLLKQNEVKNELGSTYSYQF